MGNEINYSLSGIIPETIIYTELGIVVPVLFSVQTYGADFPYFELSQMSDKSIFFTKNVLNTKKEKTDESLKNVFPAINNSEKDFRLKNHLKIGDNDGDDKIINNNDINKIFNQNNKSLRTNNDNTNKKNREKISGKNYKNEEELAVKMKEKIEEKFDPAPNSYFAIYSKNYNHINNNFNIQLGEKTETIQTDKNIVSTNTAILTKTNPFLTDMSRTKRILISAIVKGEKIQLEKRGDSIQSVGCNDHYL